MINDEKMPYILVWLLIKHRVKGFLITQDDCWLSTLSELSSLMRKIKKIKSPVSHFTSSTPHTCLKTFSKRK